MTSMTYFKLMSVNIATGRVLVSFLGGAAADGDKVEEVDGTVADENQLPKKHLRLQSLSIYLD